MTLSGIHPVDSKVDAVRNFLRPSTLRYLRELLGVINFHQLPIHHYPYFLHSFTALQPRHQTASPANMLSSDRESVKGGAPCMATIRSSGMTIKMGWMPMGIRQLQSAARCHEEFRDGDSRNEPIGNMESLMIPMTTMLVQRDV